MLRKLATLATAAASAGALAATPAPAAAPADAERACPGADAAPTPARRAAAARAVLCLVNEERAARGLRRVQPQPQLQRAAQAYVRAQRGRRSSSATEARRRIAKAGYANGDPRRFAYGEALGHGRRGLTPAERVGGWMDNAATRRLLLQRGFRDGGVAVGPAAGGTVYVLDLAVPVKQAR